MRQLEYRQKVCEEREQELLQLENTPHKFYRQKISALTEEKAELKGDIYQLEKDKRTIQANADALRKELDEKEKLYAKRLAAKERKITANYETRLHEKDSIIENLNSTVSGLKAAVKKHIKLSATSAVQPVRCGAARAIWQSTPPTLPPSRTILCMQSYNMA